VKYVYSVVRFVPDTFRGEFVNVAVIAGYEETGEWLVRCSRSIAGWGTSSS
jgi:hypothetical protein